MHGLIIILALLLSGIAYRVRGGGWITLGSTQLCRLLWGLIFCLCYVFLNAPHINLWFALSLIPTSFLGLVLVPHAYAQCMGRYPSPQRAWPSFFMPVLSQTQWTAMPLWQRQGYDFIQMAAVGFWRGLLAILPLIAVKAAYGQIFCCFELFIPPFIVGFGQALGYLAGYYTPVTITSDLTARTNTWGEFYNGPAWIGFLLSLGVVLCVK